MPLSVDELVRRIVDGGVLDAASVDSARDSLRRSLNGSVDSAALAAELRRRGLLTDWQADRLCRPPGSHEPLVLDDYVILQPLGRGGMGVVYQARHRGMDRVVAIKSMSRETLRNPRAVKRFRREVKSAARLTHPNIVQAYDAREVDGVHYLVMEYAEGETLVEHLNRRGRLPIAEAVDLMLQAAEGLAYAHGAGVIHRDVKPSNMIVTPVQEGPLKTGSDPLAREVVDDGDSGRERVRPLFQRAGNVLRILDFGLARAVREEASGDGSSEHDLSTHDRVLGTLNYMSPEQAVDSHSVDLRTDVYSLGCTLYFCLTGTSPSPEGSVVEKVSWLQSGRPASLQAARLDVPDELETLFQQMTARDKDRRLDSMHAAADKLREFAKRSGSSRPRVAGPIGDAFSLVDGSAAHRETALWQPGSTHPQDAEGRTFVPDASTNADDAPPLDDPVPPTGRSATSKLWLAAGFTVLAVVLLFLVLRDPGPDVGGLPSDASDAANSLNAGGPGGGNGQHVARRDANDPGAVVGDVIHNQPLEERRPQPRLRPAVEPLPAGRPAAPAGMFTNSYGMQFVTLPAGEYLMGSSDAEQGGTPDERPRHRVVIDAEIHIGRHEVTQAEFEALLGFNPSHFVEGGAVPRAAGVDWLRLPVESVTWDEAMQFCRILSSQKAEHDRRRLYRLPTEEEWEYACRAGTQSAVNTGPSLSSEQARFNGTKPYGRARPGENVMHPATVGSYPPNAFGLCDMHGNVWEWCEDHYRGYRGTEAEIPPVNPDAPKRVVRGGGWGFDGEECRSANRHYRRQDARGMHFGFRVVCETR